jgi:hypothetical protein
MYSIRPFIQPEEKLKESSKSDKENTQGRRDTFDKENVIEKILSDRDMKNNKSMHSARDRNSFVGMVTQDLVFDSPVRKNVTHKEDSTQERELRVNQSKCTIKVGN